MDAWSSYQEMPHDQVDWANLAQQWMAMKETEPVDDRNGTAYDGGGPWEAGKPIFPSANLEPERYNRGPNDGYNNRGAEYWGDEWGQSGNGHFHPPRPHQHPYGAPNNYPPYPHRNEPMPYQQAPRPLRNGGYESFREPDRGYDQFNEPNRGYDRYREGDHSGSWIPPANQMHRSQMQGGPAPHGGPPMQGIPPHGFFNHARLSASAFDHQPAGPIGGTMKPATPPMFTGSFADLDANARKKLPAWILEGLEKAEREKQKQTEKEERIKRAEEERAKRRALAGKGKFDSDSEEENDDADDERSRTVSAPLFDDGDPVFQARKVDPEEDLRTEEERRADAMTAVKFIMMSLLMESTDIMLRENIDSAIKASLVSRKEAAPKLISKSSALAALSSLGDDDDEESASDVEDSKSQTNGDSNTNDAVTFKAPLGIPRNFSKPDPPKQQGDTSPVVCNVKSPTAPQAVKDDSVDTDVVKITEERKRKRSRSRSREKKRSRSKDRDRKRSRSRERKRSRSRDREKKRSRSRERKRSRSRDRKRSRSKERRRRSRSGSKEKKKSAKKSRDRKRSRTRSRSRERRHR